MNKTTNTAIIIGIIVIILIAGFGVYFYLGKNTTSSGTLALQVKDSPVGTVSHIYLNVTNIKLQGNANSSTTYSVGPFSFDLLALVSVSKALGNVSIPVGNYSMIRFTIQSAIATIAGVNVSLTVPSSQVKVPISFEIKSGKTTTIVLDITADETLISASNNLRPVVTGQVTSGP